MEKLKENAALSGSCLPKKALCEIEAIAVIERTK